MLGRVAFTCWGRWCLQSLHVGAGGADDGAGGVYMLRRLVLLNDPESFLAHTGAIHQRHLTSSVARSNILTTCAYTHSSLQPRHYKNNRVITRTNASLFCPLLFAQMWNICLISSANGFARTRRTVTVMFCWQPWHVAHALMWGLMLTWLETRYDVTHARCNGVTHSRWSEL